MTYEKVIYPKATEDLWCGLRITQESPSFTDRPDLEVLTGDPNLKGSVSYTIRSSHISGKSMGLQHTQSPFVDIGVNNALYRIKLGATVTVPPAIKRRGIEMGFTE